MKRFEHKNIVKLLGVCTKNEPVYTIMEFMLYGKLEFQFGKQIRRIPFRELMYLLFHEFKTIIFNIPFVKQGT